MSKTTYYIVAIVVLLGVNLALFFSDGFVSTTEKVNTYFDANDLEQISRVTFVAEDSVVMSKTGEGWILNDQYPVDESFFNTLLSILPRIEIVRSVDGWEGELLGNAEIEFDFNSRYRFEFAANPMQTKSYFIQNGEAAEVTVPGYRDNVVDIFTLHPDQWRNRLVFDGSWRSIQKLEINSRNQEPVEIAFDDKFFLINNEPAQDSSAVVDYLNQFQYFEANEMISEGRFPQFDSLAQTEPMALIIIEDIKQDEPIEFKIFPSIKRQAYHLVMKENELMVIDARRVQGLLATSQDFLGQK